MTAESLENIRKTQITEFKILLRENCYLVRNPNVQAPLHKRLYIKAINMITLNLQINHSPLGFQHPELYPYHGNTINQLQAS